MASTKMDVTPAANAGGLCTAVVGLQWGDEGKGKVVDLIAPRFDAVVRYNGGANAGHSVVVKGERYALHLMPSGILYPGKLAIIGNGVVIDPEVVLKEVDGLNARGVDTSGLVISDRAHVVMPYHKAEDELREKALARHGGNPVTANGGGGSGGSGRNGGGGGGGGSIGTTKRGIGPCYADKAQRATAVRVGDLLRPAALRQKLELACAIKNPMLRGLAEGGEGGDAPVFEPAQLAAWAEGLAARLKGTIRDTTYLLHDMRAQGRPILFEGANAALLDVDHGTYPYVTSSSCTALGIPAGTGIPGSQIANVIGVVKAYSTRVGNGPLPTELLDQTGEAIRQRGREFGTTTGRPRRVGWLDLVAVKYSAMLSGATSLAVTLMDVLSGFPSLRVCTEYQVTGVGAHGAANLTVTDRFLPDGDLLAGVTPRYTDMPGFTEDITGVRSRSDLPAAAQAYLQLIERVVGVPIGLIGVGPARDQVIVCG